MRSVVKAQSFAALDKLPHTWVVAEDEISFKQELRSSKLDEACYILDKNKPKKFTIFTSSSTTDYRRSRLLEFMC